MPPREAATRAVARTAKAIAPTNTGRPDLPCTSVSPVLASYRPWQASCGWVMMGLNALRESVASISSATCSRRPRSTASVTGSMALAGSDIGGFREGWSASALASLVQQAAAAHHVHQEPGHRLAGQQPAVGCHERGAHNVDGDAIAFAQDGGFGAG